MADEPFSIHTSNTRHTSNPQHASRAQSEEDPPTFSNDILQQIEAARRSVRLRNEGMCPNGHGPMQALDRYRLGCPKCVFVFHAAAPHGLD